MKLLAKEFKRLEIIKRGEFVLKSGQVSDYYIDIKKAFGNPKAFDFICNQLCKIVDKKATCVVGSGHGGIPLAAAISIKLNLPLVLVRDKVKKHGVQKNIDGYLPTRKDKAVIVDDVFTTGTCISSITNILAETKAKILSGYVIVNRGDVSKFTIPIKSLLAVEELTK